MLKKLWLRYTPWQLIRNARADREARHAHRELIE